MPVTLHTKKKMTVKTFEDISELIKILQINNMNFVANLPFGLFNNKINNIYFSFTLY